jgi:hypothetical protein
MTSSVLTFITVFTCNVRAHWKVFRGQCNVFNYCINFLLDFLLTWLLFAWLLSYVNFSFIWHFICLTFVFHRMCMQKFCSPLSNFFFSKHHNHFSVLDLKLLQFEIIFFLNSIHDCFSRIVNNLQQRFPLKSPFYPLSFRINKFVT